MKKLLLFLMLCTSWTAFSDTPIFEPVDDFPTAAGLGFWTQYRTSFGMEKTYISFPRTPTVTQGTTLLTASAYDRSTCYTFTGYYPPVSNIDTTRFFQDMLNTVSAYPYSLLYHSIYENACGNWVLEYTAQDTYRNYIIRTFSVVTPFNAYTLQTTYPVGAYERYTYFRDSFKIACECCR